jgi:hypothetical protein
MRTTIELPDDLFREVKIRAAREGVKLKDLITTFVAAGLHGSPAENVAPTQPRRRSEFPIFQRRTGEPLPRLTNTEIEEILLQEDLERMKFRLD